MSDATGPDPAMADRSQADDLVFPPDDLDQLLDLARFIRSPHR